MKINHKIIKGFLSISFFTLLAFLFVGCSNNQSNKSTSSQIDSTEIKQEIIEKQAKQKEENIALIKTLEMVYFEDRINIYNSMNAIAGVEGTVDWNIIYPDEYKDKPNLCLVEGTANGMEKNKKRQFYLQLLLNKETGQFEVKKATDNGKKLTKLELMMTLAIEGGWKSGVSDGN